MNSVWSVETWYAVFFLSLVEYPRERIKITVKDKYKDFSSQYKQINANFPCATSILLYFLFFDLDYISGIGRRFCSFLSLL